jgi:hypothetical protein
MQTLYRGALLNINGFEEKPSSLVKLSHQLNITWMDANPGQVIQTTPEKSYAIRLAVLRFIFGLVEPETRNCIFNGEIIPVVYEIKSANNNTFVMKTRKYGDKRPESLSRLKKGDALTREVSVQKVSNLKILPLHPILIGQTISLLSTPAYEWHHIFDDLPRAVSDFGINPQLKESMLRKLDFLKNSGIQKYSGYDFQKIIEIVCLDETGKLSIPMVNLMGRFLYANTEIGETGHYYLTELSQEALQICSNLTVKVYSRIRDIFNHSLTDVPTGGAIMLDFTREEAANQVIKENLGELDPRPDHKLI